MNTSTSLSHHPAPHRERVTLPALAFGVAGGPLAWGLQLNAGFALASWPCFPGDQRMQLPLDGYAWTWPTLVAVMFAGALIALAALWVSWSNLQKTREEHSGGHGHLMDTGSGRTRFLALWGIAFGAGFAVASLVTGIAFIVLPRCAG